MTKSFFELEVSFFLYCLSVLKTLYKFHLEFLHLRYFVHFHISKIFLLVTFVHMISLSTSLFSSSLLLHFHLSKSLRLKSNLILHFVLLFNSKQILSFSLFVLLFNHFWLFCLFFLLKQESILNFSFFFVSLLRNHIVILRHVSFLLIFQLNIEDFLYKQMVSIAIIIWLTF